MSEKLTMRWTAARAGFGKLAASRAFRVAIGLTSTVGIGGFAAVGCLDRPIGTVQPRTTSTVVDVLTQSSVDKIDVLLVIDNSGSMGDKQTILATAVPKLVERLVTPACVGATKDNQGQQAPRNEDDGKCPDDFEAEFKPINDINIGIVSSSLGSAGTKLCDPAVTGRPNDNDYGHLIYRSASGTATNDVATYENLGFLAWDPEQNRPCVGELPGGKECPGSDNAKGEGGLIPTLTQMVTGVGEVGCGFEAPLEAAYRFLVDPSPGATIPRDGETEDDTLLKQRAAFLRPDSLLAVIVLTDENDCSLREDGIGQFGGNRDQAMPLPRGACANDPDDPCCASCIDPIPDGCDGNDGCSDPGNVQDSANYYEADSREQGIELRCWDQKRRFGLSYLYPIERYVNAFSQLRINPKKLDLAVAEDGSGGEANPLFTDLQDIGRSVRPPDLVFFAGIVGVPWQLIARKNADGEPDLIGGLNTFLGDGVPYGAFQSYDELEQNGIWKDLIPDNATDDADDPHMIEQPDPRSDLSSDPNSDPINGNEWETNYTDLQYACIFDLPPDDQRVCEAEAGTSCDCSEAADNTGKPLCDPDEPRRQTKAKAYPGTRILQVLNGLKNQGIPASICPRQLDAENAAANDYGYTPAVFAIIDRLKTKLGGSCQPRQLVPDPKGDTPCIVIEAQDSDGDKKPETSKQCAEKCKVAGRAPVGEKTKAAADKIQSDLDEEDPSPGFDCLCEILQLQGDPKDPKSDRYHCQNDESVPDGVDGWCYIDATTVPVTGNPELVSGCPQTEQRLVRFVRGGEVTPGGRLYITCAGTAAGGEDDAPAESSEE